MDTNKEKKVLTPEELERKRKKEGTAPKDKDTAARDIWKPKRDRMDLSESEAPTVQRVMQIAERVSKGESRMGLQRWMMESWGIGDRQARAYYMAAVRYLTPDDEDGYRNGLIQANLNRLENIVQDTMTGRNYRDAITAIKELNRMLGIGERNTVEVATEGPAVFKISFGED
jgi:hypothetical protein